MSRDWRLVALGPVTLPERTECDMTRTHTYNHSLTGPNI